MTAPPALPAAERGQVAARITVLSAASAAAMPAEAVVSALGTSADYGLSTAEAARRRAAVGANAVRDHRARPLALLIRQFSSPLLILLIITAALSYVLGQRTDAVIIGLILAASAGLGFANEYRAERAAEALHEGVQHTVVVLRDGKPGRLPVTDLVPGDVVRLRLGTVVPADMRLLTATALEADESVLTGESLPAEKATAAVAAGTALGDLASVALMGTVVRAGEGTGVVVATGSRAEFGRIAAGLGTRQPETDFQAGLRRFSVLLLRVAIVLSVFIVIISLLLRRSLIESLLFALAIAVGITPQLLPAVVSTSLATGSRRLARRKVLVKRLVAIEDLGDLDILVTDKTGTLTEGRITFTSSVNPAGGDDGHVRDLGLLAVDPGQEDDPGNPLDSALWQAAGGWPAGYTRLASLPFDHERRMASTLVSGPDGQRLLVTKGAPEAVLAACSDVPAAARSTLDELFAGGGRIVAVASRDASGLTAIAPADESGLTLAGFLVFLDPPKPSTRESLMRLNDLGVQVKIATGDNATVAQKLYADIGMPATRAMTGPELDQLSDDQLRAAAAQAGIFARVSPEQKARLIRVLRHEGRAVGFLGDGVNDALALHAADVGISVQGATDVAKDAADVILLEKSLDVLADGVNEGRRIFANTIKYVLMGTASNFGNIFSAAAASAILAFLPLLPSQILLNNLLYDSSQLAIPTDRVDPEQLAAPSHWNIGMIERFMLVFGPLSSLFDFITFGTLLGGLHAGPELFRSGWFVESLATQTLVIFAVRTRRVPFLRSRPSWQLASAALVVVAIGVVLPLSPLAGVLGFVAPPASFYLVLAGLVVVYLVLVEVVKKPFYQHPGPSTEQRTRRGRTHRIQRRAARFSSSTRHPRAVR